MTQSAKAGSTVEDVDLVADAHLDARGVSAVAQVLGLWSGRGAAHAPKLDPHKNLGLLNDHLLQFSGELELCAISCRRKMLIIRTIFPNSSCYLDANKGDQSYG